MKETEKNEMLRDLITLATKLSKDRLTALLFWAEQYQEDNKEI